jgi:peptidoglycan/LPS O-acetylase OafA/YrhL
MATTVGGEPASVIASQDADGAAAPSGVSRLLAYVEPHRGGRFASLDGFRAVAALGVVVYHVAGYASQTNADTIMARFLNNLGNYGVATFFLLSGFLLYRPFVLRWFRDEPAPDPVLYLRHRFLRILPAYWLALSAFLVLGLQQAKNPGGDHYVTLYALIQTYRNSFGFAGLTVAWTLCIEVSFYLALPLIAAAIRLIGTSAHTLRMKLEAQLIGLVCLYVISLAYRAMFAGPWSYNADKSHNGWTGHLWLPNYLDWFALGMLLAVCVCWTDMGRRLPLLFQRLANTGWACWLAAAACYVTLMMVRSAGEAGAGGAGKEDTAQMFTRFFLNGAAAFFFLLPGIIGRRQDSLINRGLASIVPMYLGTISYGIYLWHKVWLDYLKPDDPKAPHTFLPMLAMVLGLTLVSASISYYFLERPIMAFKNPRRLRSSAKPTVPA